MAEKRMFTRKITESDAFLDMPTSTQALYFHLNMNADDDGFLNNPKRIQRTVGASDDDMRLLILKNFIIVFDSGIIVIKHWKMHNYIQSDRYKPTDYIEEKSMLMIKKNKSYKLNENGIEECIPGNSTDNVKTDEIDENTICMENFELIYANYPLKKGKQDAFRHYKAWGTGKKKNDCGIKKLSNEQMYNAVIKYVEEVKANGKLEFLKHFSTFMNNGIIDYLEKDDEE